MIKNIRPLPPKHPGSYCNCPETFIARGSDDSMKSGVQHPQPQFHDCRYIRDRNERIQAAFVAASAHERKIMGEPNPSLPKVQYEKWLAASAKTFNTRFTAEMEQRLRVI